MRRLPPGAARPVQRRAGYRLGAAAAVCWAAYICLNRTAGARLPGLQAPALAAALCALAYLPVLLVLGAQDRLGGAWLGYAVAAGVLASVVPYAADLVALRVVPARFFGVFMSIHPVVAALAGTVLLGQLLAVHEWAGIVVVVLANATAVSSAGDRRPRAAAPRRRRGPLPRSTAGGPVRCPPPRPAAPTAAAAAPRRSLPDHAAGR